MRRPPPALALAAPAVDVDDVFITRLADLAAASMPSRVPVRPATLKVAAAAASVAVIAAGGAYAADQLTAPAPQHHVPPAGEPRPTDDSSPTSRNSDRTLPAPSGAHEHGGARGLSGPGAAPGAAADHGGTGGGGTGGGGAGEGEAAQGHGQGASHGQGDEHAGDHPNHGTGHEQDEGDTNDHGRKGHGTPPGDGQENGQGQGIDQGLGLGNDVVPDPPVPGD